MLRRSLLRCGNLFIDGNDVVFVALSNMIESKTNIL